eukprot:gnl/TRDRNA2_/TRDRNA2_28803_c0_seq1.p1 gnl/TRDRNA2_/TRDRNA2_28803_c0~~gnl/TRDRNA2_/TRDRNA2_28803_c0_seq1.p1  ORF type:complete len:361 (-),score=51.06 gnl/TRDRNA2_/TRDRNA2_28803_c0_seq1:63-1145(-)
MESFQDLSKPEMANSIKLCVQLTKKTLDVLSQCGLAVPWNEVLKEFNFQVREPPITIEDLSTTIEDLIEESYYRYGGKGQIQCQTRMVTDKSEKRLPFGDYATHLLKPGDTIILDMMAVTQQPQPQFTAQDIEKLRSTLRFGLNDRVLCFVGPRWLAGHIVGTAVVDEGDILPYLVKTDPNPGLPSRTISVPNDSDNICRQEICFNPTSQMHLVKGAARTLPASKKGGFIKPKLRFAVGDKVVCRIQSNPDDGLEQWAPGSISEVWPNLPGELAWDMGEVKGQFPEVVPYKVDMSSGEWVFCHWDDHSLIRREGFEPLTRVRGISQRMEVRTAKDGTKEKVDHATERRKRIIELDEDNED